MSDETRMRAKVRVSSVFPYRDQQTGETVNEMVDFHGVSKSDGPYPADGSDENNTFSKYSPSVNFRITIANPALFGKFESGDTFYCDFTPAPK